MITFVQSELLKWLPSYSFYFPWHQTINTFSITTNFASADWITRNNQKSRQLSVQGIMESRNKMDKVVALADLHIIELTVLLGRDPCSLTALLGFWVIWCKYERGKIDFSALINSSSPHEMNYSRRKVALFSLAHPPLKKKIPYFPIWDLLVFLLALPVQEKSSLHPSSNHGLTATNHTLFVVNAAWIDLCVQTLVLSWTN